MLYGPDLSESLTRVAGLVDRVQKRGEARATAVRAAYAPPEFLARAAAQHIPYPDMLPAFLTSGEVIE
jgi:hypothetical protein